MRRPRLPAAAVSGAIRALLSVAGFVLLLALALDIVYTSASRPWDFYTYWYACTAALHGRNPYDAGVLTELAQRPVGMPFLYPPITVPLLTPLTLLPVERAAQVWFAVKALMLASLVLLWRRYFLPAASVLLLAAVAIFGFNGACVWDLRAGNVAILEQLLLWAGFAAFTMDRRRIFAGCMVAAALFKLFPIAFLALLLIPSKKSSPDWKLAGGALALFVGLVTVPLLAGPAWARDFLRQLPVERPWGIVNPSALGLIDTLLGDHTTPLTSPPFLALGLWVAYGAALVGLSAPTLRRLWRERESTEWVMAGAILYALLVPRMMVYSYLLVLVPVLALITPIVSRLGSGALVAAILVSQALLGRVLGWGYQAPWWVANLAFLMLLGFWLVYLFAGGRHLDSDQRLPPAEP